MGLIGLIIAIVVNLFLKSTGLEFVISAVGVLIFAGLTAWDTQRIKEMYDPMEDGTVVGRKAVMGALSLYLDFINLFLFLLRFRGDRRGRARQRTAMQRPGNPAGAFFSLAGTQPGRRRSAGGRTHLFFPGLLATLAHAHPSGPSG
jgi:hypothetical protein